VHRINKRLGNGNNVGNDAPPSRAVVLKVPQYLGALTEANRACRRNAVRPDFLAPSGGQMRSGKDVRSLGSFAGHFAVVDLANGGNLKGPISANFRHFAPVAQMDRATDF
jgi:hypothetical protein